MINTGMEVIVLHHISFSIFAMLLMRQQHMLQFLYVVVSSLLFTINFDLYSFLLVAVDYTRKST